MRSAVLSFEIMQITNRTPNAQRPMPSDAGLFAGSFGCGNDSVEARITAQRIPTRIKAQIAVCRASRDLRDNFELPERAVAFTGPRVNVRQGSDKEWPRHRVLGSWHEFDCPKRFANRVFFS